MSNATSIPPEETKHPHSDLLGLNGVNHRIKHWRSEKVKIAEQYTAVRGSPPPKSMDHGQANHRYVEEQHGTEVGDTSVEGFEAPRLGGNGQHCMEDQPVGEDDEHCVHTQRGEHHEETIGTIDVGVCTG